jgi:hypothetical protein
VFGPGEFPCILSVAAPGYDFLGNTLDLMTASRRYGWPESEVQRSGLPTEQAERLGRLFYFGRQHGREWLGWDLTDVRDTEASEYGIYRVDWLSDGAEFVAASFRELVEGLCESIFAPDPEWDEETLGPRLLFQPACLVPEASAQAEPGAAADRGPVSDI